MRRGKIYIIIIFIIILGIFLSYNVFTAINEGIASILPVSTISSESIQGKLENNLGSKIRLLKNIDIYNKRIQLFIVESTGWIGLCEYYKVNETKFKPGIIYTQQKPYITMIIKTNGKRYFVVGGTNSNNRIAGINYLINSYNVKFDVSKEDIFLKYNELSNNINVNANDIENNLKFCDKNNIDITSNLK